MLAYGMINEWPTDWRLFNWRPLSHGLWFLSSPSPLVFWFSSPFLNLLIFLYPHTSSEEGRIWNNKHAWVNYRSSAQDQKRFSDFCLIFFMHRFGNLWAQMMRIVGNLGFGRFFARTGPTRIILLPNGPNTATLEMTSKKNFDVLESASWALTAQGASPL